MGPFSCHPLNRVITKTVDGDEITLDPETLLASVFFVKEEPAKLFCEKVQTTIDSDSLQKIGYHVQGMPEGFCCCHLYNKELKSFVNIPFCVLSDEQAITIKKSHEKIFQLEGGL